VGMKIILCLLFLLIGYMAGVLAVFHLLRRKRTIESCDWVYMAIKKDEIEAEDLSEGAYNGYEGG